MRKYHVFRHLHTVDKHRFLVFINCCKCGIPFRGLVHDLSKYSPSEFWVSARNYLGTRSPIANERKEEYGYSKAFIHHTRRNRHHYEYWVDVTTGDIVLIPMPYKYALECCCDMISASMTYNKGHYNRGLPLEFFLRTEERSLMHPATKEFIRSFLSEYKETGFRNLKKKKTRKMYKEICARYKPTEIIPLYSRTHPEACIDWYKKEEKN